MLASISGMQIPNRTTLSQNTLFLVSRCNCCVCVVLRRDVGWAVAEPLNNSLRSDGFRYRLTHPTLFEHNNRPPRAIINGH